MSETKRTEPFGLPDVLKGKIEPGCIFDRVIGLDEGPDGYGP